MAIQAPKGTKDMLPQDAARWHYIENIMREECAVRGFKEIRTPVFEHTELFLRGVGDTTDVVQKEMYTFEDKGGRSITLRPEGTAGAARSFIESGLAGGPQPTKLYYMPLSVFRYERPQSGRLREHHQFGIEMFGAQGATADAEVITLALSVLNRLGVHSLKLNINSIGCPKCRPKYNEVLKAYLESRKDELCHTCLERMDRNPLRILDCKSEQCQAVADEAPKMIEYLCEDCAEHLEELKGILEAQGIEYAINSRIVRGLDYYTKTVFEIISAEIGAQGTVCGGGRYDGLISQLGGPAMPGVGFGMGMERLLMVMDAAGTEFPVENGPKLFICTMGKEARKFAFSLISELRAAGVYADMDHAQRSLKAQFKFANKVGAAYTLTVGDSEIESGMLRLKDMAKSEEREITRDELVKFILKAE